MVKNRVNLTWTVKASSDKELIQRVEELLSEFERFGVRSLIGSHLGIVEIERREVSPEQYMKEVHECALGIREREEEKQDATS